MSEKPTQDDPQVPSLSTMNQPTPTAEIPISTQSPSATTTAQSSAPATTATQATPPITTTASTPPQDSTNSPPQSLNSKFNAGDRYWKFKTALRAILILMDIIGVGCLGWAVATAYIYDSSYMLFGSLIPLSVSCVWSSICVIVFLVRKRPVHPGARVALDLLLWLTFIFTVLTTLYSVISDMSWGESGRIYGYEDRYGYYSSNGGYTLADNGTWVWESRSSSYSSSNSGKRACEKAGNTYGYATCAEEDAFINQLWREKPHRINVEMTGLVSQFFGIVLHFTLFVWACVDTHRRNKGGASKDAEKLAAEIVMKMVKDGAIIPPPGQAHVMPPMPQQVFYPHQGVYANQQMYPQQMYPQQMYPQQMYPQQIHPQQVHAKQMPPQPAGPSSQSGGVARYA